MRALAAWQRLESLPLSISPRFEELRPGFARVSMRKRRAVTNHIGLKHFPGYAQIRRIATLDEPWTVDNGLLTSTMKPKRAQILERYKVQVEALYARR